MGNNTKKVLLPPMLMRMMQQVGEQIRLARKRRHYSTILISERAGISRTTLYKIEQGDPSVAIGLYLKALAGIGLDKDILKIAADDELGRLIQDAELERGR
jgi:transcriptional regulator with XRE-family HTH domain